MPVKESGLGILNPVTSAQKNYLSSTRGSAELVRDVTGRGAFSDADHLRTLSEKQRDGKKYQNVVYKSRLKGFVINLKGADKRLFLRAKITSAYLSIHGTTVSGTVLTATEFWIFNLLVITSLP